jgi:uncharacterized membrane protein YcaP (DUF421 family)
MKKEEIFLYDWKRILLGEAPPEFLAEVFFRTHIVYFFLLVAMRIMGKRMTGQMSVYELAVIVMLGAIVSAPMQMPDKGIFVGLFILMITVLLHRFLNLASIRSTRVEHITQGNLSILIKNGKLQLAAMKKASLSRETLFADLRGKSISHLGQIKRAYLEANGSLSIFTNGNSQPGLSILPDTDLKLKSHSKVMKGCYVCISCGNTSPENLSPELSCTDCGNNHWTEAIY